MYGDLQFGDDDKWEVDPVHAEVERLRAALTEAHRQLSLHDYKGPKQIGRALTTMERALGIERDIDAEIDALTGEQTTP